MSKPDDPNNETRSATGALSANDLMEFHLRWPEFRPVAHALFDHQQGASSEAETLKWLIALADRISEADIS